ncbi:hypothetical protein [Photorhabdus bodei]|uniref:Uncharacterized protein n=1 Tax=Photorhabdus bodei TaxID=2029681 RepID=A0AAW6BHL0_9GAMM|nr:hypothetical protein [Photorhabdus bodei]MDB6372932.1 hypothetical protein [Photorhabdus bodei]
MKKLTITTIMILMMALSCICVFLWLFMMPNVIYKENDFLKYHLLTNEKIKEVPRISKNYFFEYYPNDESSPIYSSVYFCDLIDMENSYNRIVEYIKSTGYIVNNDAIWYMKGFETIYDDSFILSKSSVAENEKKEHCLALTFAKNVK